jgi:hypothetical protein
MCHKYNNVYECGDKVKYEEICHHKHVDVIPWNDRKKSGNCPTCKSRVRQEARQEKEAEKQKEEEEKLRLKVEGGEEEVEGGGEVDRRGEALCTVRSLGLDRVVVKRSTGCRV